MAVISHLIYQFHQLSFIINSSLPHTSNEIWTLVLIDLQTYYLFDFSKGDLLLLLHDDLCVPLANSPKWHDAYNTCYPKKLCR
jgi:hypothetical protein